MFFVTRRAALCALTGVALFCTFAFADRPLRTSRRPGALSSAKPWRVVTRVSPAFHETVQQAIHTVPPNIWSLLQRHGWKVYLAEYVTDAAPSLRGRQPRGWPPGTTWDNTEAAHLPTRQLLVLAEKRRTSAGKAVTSSRHSGVFRHEVGHAYDAAARGRERLLSSSAPFLRAYSHDQSTVSRQDSRRLEYYLQKRAAGREETFAEAFAILLGGGSDRENEQLFVRNFPQVLAFVRGHLRSLSPEQIASHGAAASSAP